MLHSFPLSLPRGFFVLTSIGFRPSQKVTGSPLIAAACNAFKFRGFAPVAMISAGCGQLTDREQLFEKSTNLPRVIDEVNLEDPVALLPVLTLSRIRNLFSGCT